MGLFLRQDENRSELQSKIIADLQQKVRQTTSVDGIKPDTVEPTFLENQHETRTAGVIIGLLVVVLVIVVAFIATRG
jgi:preprotein translocase subunit SecF